MHHTISFDSTQLCVCSNGEPDCTAVSQSIIIYILVKGLRFLVLLLISHI